MHGTSSVNHLVSSIKSLVMPRLAVVGGIALIASAVAASLTPDGLARWLHGYLLAVVYFITISLGGLFFVILQHLTGARWSVVVRRVAEIVASTIRVLAWLLAPLLAYTLFGGAELYSWNDVEIRATDPLVVKKLAYLNAPFFVFRACVYVVIWMLLARFYFRTSVQQDKSCDPMATVRMRRWSGPAMILFAVSVNFAAFDWLMSLDPHWFSTIFGVYFFAGSVVAFLATLPVVIAYLQGQGLLRQEVTVEHYHDLGKLLFGFTFFWAYIAFSQYLLIWYANIPEETLWFKTRQSHGWLLVSILLIIGHFILPFFGLISRSSRRSRVVLVAWAIFLLAMHWVDLLWLIGPTFSPDRVSFGAIEILGTLGVAAIWMSSLRSQLGCVSLVPSGDANLSASLSFHNI